MSVKVICVFLIVHRCAAMVSHFIDLDITNDDVSLFLKDYILPAADGVF